MSDIYKFLSHKNDFETSSELRNVPFMIVASLTPNFTVITFYSQIWPYFILEQKGERKGGL